MKELIKSIVSETSDKLKARSLVREYLQARILQILQESGVFSSWVFHGGTALRFLFHLPRYSEDLDFSLLKTDKSAGITPYISNIIRDFEFEAYHVDVNLKENKNIYSAHIRFPGLYHELDLSPHHTETLSIKIELDINPPSGGTAETSIIRRYIVLHLQHYDKGSLLSGKLHAILNRSYVKGRDIYDIYWYLSNPEWPKPNIEFLNLALKQTNWDGPDIDRKNWISIIENKLANIDWKNVINDVSPFIERDNDLELLTKENLFKILRLKKE